MGLERDKRRFEEIGEEKRQDLEEYIQQGQLGEDIEVPIKVIDLPEIEYDPQDKGGIGQGEGAEEGDPVDVDPEEGDGEDEAGDESGEHTYEMTPEEFAKELDEKWGLDLEPKGKQTEQEEIGSYSEIARQGTKSTLDMDRFIKNGMKRSLVTNLSEENKEYIRELLRVDGIGVKRAFKTARKHNLPISLGRIEELANEVEETGKYDDKSEIEQEPDPTNKQVVREKGFEFRKEDEKYRHPEIKKEKSTNAVIVNIRDVSSSMREEKRELVERVFTPLDWYLQGKYDNAVFIYIAHDADAWEVEREEFFGITSGGGTKISSAYELAKEILQEFPYENWNRFVFAAGDGENKHSDTKDNVIPLMKDIPANRHAYVEVSGSGGRRGQYGGSGRSSTHGSTVQDELVSEDSDEYAVSFVDGKDDIIPAIKNILDEQSTGDTQ